MVSSSPLSFFFSRSSSSGNPSSSPRRMKILNELYEVTTLIDYDVILYCFFSIYDLIVFKKAMKNAK
jgi:hypothetical protein